jgi:uncharacterized protein YehS (DUF1456 family)
MTNDVLRQVRYAFDFDDDTMIAIFAAAGLEVTRSQVSDWLKRDEDPAFRRCTDQQLASFLNGLINHRRGKKDGPQPVPERRLTNNLILRKLRIALDFKEEDMLHVMELAGMPISKPELSALFRKADHKHYRACQDQLLRNFLRGVQLKFRPEP